MAYIWRRILVQVLFVGSSVFLVPQITRRHFIELQLLFTNVRRTEIEHHAGKNRIVRFVLVFQTITSEKWNRLTCICMTGVEMRVGWEYLPVVVVVAVVAAAAVAAAVQHLQTQSCFVVRTYYFRKT